MSIDKNKIITQEEAGEVAPIDEVEGRVEAEMKLIEGRAKERVAQGLQDKELEREARKMETEAERELERARIQTNNRLRRLPPTLINAPSHAACVEVPHMASCFSARGFCFEDKRRRIMRCRRRPKPVR